MRKKEVSDLVSRRERGIRSIKNKKKPFSFFKRLRGVLGDCFRGC